MVCTSQFFRGGREGCRDARSNSWKMSGIGRVENVAGHGIAASRSRIGKMGFGVRTPKRSQARLKWKIMWGNSGETLTPMTARVLLKVMLKTWTKATSLNTCKDNDLKTSNSASASVQHWLYQALPSPIPNHPRIPPRHVMCPPPNSPSPPPHGPFKPPLPQ